MNKLKTGTHQVAARLILVFSFLICFTGQALGYDVEEDSNANTVYMLLLNDNPGAVFHSISIGNNVPAFVTSASASIVPPTVLGGASDLAALEFNVVPGAVVGTTGDLIITASGLAAGTAISVVFTVPLEVVASAPATQGFVGSSLPVPDPGGIDTDGDGVTDALESAFGSNPNSSSSLPGQTNTQAEENVPLFAFAAYPLLAILLLGFGIPALRQRQRKEHK